MKPILIAPLVVIAFAATVIAFLFIIGPLQDDGGQPEDTSAQTVPDGPEDTTGQIVGGGGPPYYLEPVPLTSGDYFPSSFPFESVAEKGLAVLEEEKEKPQFEGSLNGFRIYSFEHAFEDPSVEKDACVAVEFPLTDDLKFNYLPPGTFAASPQYSGVCVGGSVAFILQEFVTKHGEFDIGYEPGERAFRNEAPAERVEAGTVNGRAAIVTHPPVEEGFGPSAVFVATNSGIVGVDASNLPLSETLKIAEGIGCKGC